MNFLIFSDVDMSQKVSEEWKTDNHCLKRKMLLDLSTDVENGGNKNQVIYELMSSCVLAARADGGHLYLMDKDAQVRYLTSVNRSVLKKFLFRRFIFTIRTKLGSILKQLWCTSHWANFITVNEYFREPQPSRRYRPSSAQTVSAFVARTLETARTPDVSKVPYVNLLT